MIIVLDSNVWVSAFVKKEGFCASLLSKIFKSHRVASSEYIIAEVSRILQDKFDASPQQIYDATSFIRKNSQIIVPKVIAVKNCPDRDDWPVIGTAVAASADMLVTGDKELIDMGFFKDIRIVSPRTFYNLLQSKQPEA